MQCLHMKTIPINKHHAQMVAYYDTKCVSEENTNSSTLAE